MACQLIHPNIFGLGVTLTHLTWCYILKLGFIPNTLFSALDHLTIINIVTCTSDGKYRYRHTTRAAHNSNISTYLSGS